MTRDSTKRTVYIGAPLATMFAEHLASGIPLNALNPEDYVQLRVPRRRRSLPSSLLNEDTKATKKYLLRLVIFTMILASYMFLGSLLFFYVEECVQKDSKININIREESARILRAALRNICLKLNTSQEVDQAVWLIRHVQTDEQKLPNRSNIAVEKCLSHLMNLSQPLPVSWPTACEFSLLAFVKWMHFVAATCFTIGKWSSPLLEFRV